MRQCEACLPWCMPWARSQWPEHADSAGTSLLDVPGGWIHPCWMCQGAQPSTAPCRVQSYSPGKAIATAAGTQRRVDVVILIPVQNA